MCMHTASAKMCLELLRIWRSLWFGNFESSNLFRICCEDFCCSYTGSQVSSKIQWGWVLACIEPVFTFNLSSAISVSHTFIRSDRTCCNNRTRIMPILQVIKEHSCTKVQPHTLEKLISRIKSLHATKSTSNGTAFKIWMIKNSMLPGVLFTQFSDCLRNSQRDNWQIPTTNLNQSIWKGTKLFLASSEPSEN